LQTPLFCAAGSPSHTHASGGRQDGATPYQGLPDICPPPLPLPQLSQPACPTRRRSELPARRDDVGRRRWRTGATDRVGPDRATIITRQCALPAQLREGVSGAGPEEQDGPISGAEAGTGPAGAVCRDGARAGRDPNPVRAGGRGAGAGLGSRGPNKATGTAPSETEPIGWCGLPWPWASEKLRRGDSSLTVG
jgi:hypothetical protein